VEPLLRTWTGSRRDRFLERACDYGYKILAELEHHDADTRAAYHVAQLIFRNRHAGHVRAARNFRCAADFVDFTDAASPAIILPGLDGKELRHASSAETIHAKARDLLRGALRATGSANGGGGLSFETVVGVYERIVAASTLPAMAPSDGVEANEMFIVRTIPNPVREQIERQVRSALIMGPVTDDDFRRVTDDEETLRLFLGNLERKALSGTDPPAFDKWLQRVRHEGYLQLVNGRNLRGSAREQAREQAERIYCWLLWQSYRMMAKCYGVLMALISADFAINNENRPPDKSEQLLFDLENRQVDFLAELPLAFLESSQLRWIVRTLHKLEACLVQRDFTRYQANWGDRESAFADIPALLGIYGTISRERRGADRRVKSQRRNSRAVRFGQSPEGDSLDNLAVDQAAAPVEIEEREENAGSATMQLLALQCPRLGCGATLNSPELVDQSDLQRAIIEVYCPRCDDRARYWTDLTRPQ
jgi:hypothetical protein